MISLSPLGIAAAGMVPVLVGLVWYHPSLFGTRWMRMTGMTPAMVERVRSHRITYGLWAIIAGLVTAYVINALLILAAASSLGVVLRVGFWAWAGFAAPILLGGVLWEGQHLRMYAINAGYWFAVIMIMAVVVHFFSFA